jgi:hypothetical protein
MILLAMAAMAVELQQCKVEDAVYRQRGSAITAEFLAVDTGPEWPANLALKLHVGDSGRDYWWLPWNGGSNGTPHLASTTAVTAPGWQPPRVEARRPLGDVGYIGMDEAYNVLDGAPRKSAQAPAHFHIPDLRNALWYSTPPDKRDASSGQFFDLVGCKGGPAKAR